MARRRPAEPTVNPARGAALVVVAVLIGLFLLRNGLDTSEAITNQGGSDTSSDGDDAGSTDGDGGDTTTTTAPAVRPPSEVTVIVLNGTSVDGAAGVYSDALATAGYVMSAPAGADADATATQVYFAPGFEAEAAAVATAIGAPAVAPAAVPVPPPGPISTESVVVVIGPDIASITPTTVTTATTVAAN
jgi:hypothetical protein